MIVQKQHVRSRFSPECRTRFFSRQMEAQDQRPDPVSPLLTEVEGAYRAYRTGGTNLEALYGSLRALIDEIEERRLEQPQSSPSPLFLGRYDMYETAAAVSYALGYAVDAFEHAERARARFLLDRTLNKVRFDATRLQDKSLLEREVRLGQQIKDLSQRLQLAGVASMGSESTEVHASEESVTSLREARNQLLTVQQEIREQDPAFAALRGVRPASLSDVQVLLEKDCVLLAYCVTEERVLIFTVTKSHFWADHTNISRHELSDLVQRYREQVEKYAVCSRDILVESRIQESLPPHSSTLDLDLADLERNLYRILLEPVHAHLVGKAQICVIPDGDLHLVPFHALRSDDVYLIETFGVWYAPSVSFLDLCCHRQQRSQGRLLAMGNPNLGNPALALPFAEQEVISIASIFKAESYVGSEANVDTLRREWDKCDLLHLACHAQWDPQQPEFTALLLTPTDNDSGRLEVRELFALDRDLALSQVILSACRTSLGVGNDLIGLATGFLYAGAPAVVSSLWRVDDFSTSELMVELYRNLMDFSRAEALRAAQLKLLKSSQYAHPYHWASFKLTGTPSRIDSDSVSLSAFNLVHRSTYRSPDGTLWDPVISGNTLYATWSEMGDEKDSDFEKACRRSALIALSLEDRRPLWRWESKRSGRAFCFRAGLVHFNSLSGVVALDACSGDVKWEHAVAGHFHQTLRDDGRLLFVGGRSRSVYALDPDSGEIIWEYALPRPASGGFAAGGAGVFVGCKDHHIYALNSIDGHLMWKRDLGFAEWNSDHAWVVGQSLRTTIGALSVVDGRLDTSQRLGDDERVSEGDRLLTEKVQEYPRQFGIYLKTSYLYLDQDLAFEVRAEDGNRTFLNLFDVVSGALLRRFSLGDRPISGICRSGDRAVVGLNGRLMVFSIQKSVQRKL